MVGIAFVSHMNKMWGHELASQALNAPKQGAHARKQLSDSMDWVNMCKPMDKFMRTCHECQFTKKSQKKCGHLPTEQAETTPWQRGKHGFDGAT